MKTPSYFPTLATLAALHLATFGVCAQEKPAPAAPPAPAATPTATPSPTPVKRSPLKYTPPKTTGGGARVDGDGGSRGGTDKLPMLLVLAPPTTGITTQAQPMLFWYQSEPSQAGFELTITDPAKPEPLLSVKGKPGQKAGIQSVALATHQKTLDPKVAYKWSVALVPDAQNRSKDVIATGIIQRVDAPAELAAKIEKASPADRAAIYAESGYWYDALQAISLAITDANKNKDKAGASELKALRASLLEQGNLKLAAAADRK